MPTPLASHIAEILKGVRRRPSVCEAARLRRERHAERHVPQQRLTHFAVKGTWEAHEVEPFLAPPRSSLNPAFIVGDEDL